MSKPSRLIFFCFLILLFSCKKNIVIENPDYDANGGNSDVSYRIDRIELTDSAAILDMSFYHFPGYWVKISEDTKLKGVKTGKEYTLFKTEGMMADSLEWMQKDAFRTATLFFEPIDPEDREVDFIESDDWIIKGLKLYDTREGKIKTNLSGTLDLFGGSWLKVVEIGDDPYFGKSIVIPVREGKFNYDFYTEEPRLFMVMIGKQFRSMTIKPDYFWTEGDSIKLIYPKGNIENSQIKGGLLTTELNEYLERSEEENNKIYAGYPLKEKELKDNKNYYTPEWMDLEYRVENEAVGRERENLLEKIRELYVEDRAYTEEGKKLIEEERRYYLNNKEQIGEDILKFQEKEFSNPTMTGLAMLYRNVRASDGNINNYIEIFVKNYKDFHPEHPYHKYLTEISLLYEPTK